MNETREVLGVWTWEGWHKPRNSRHAKAREEFVNRHFDGKPPAFIWRVEFFKVTDHYHGDDVSYGMTLFRYASKPEGGRYRTWVKVYGHDGEAVNYKAVATLEAENHRLPYRSDGTLPPEWLLLGNPEPQENHD